MKRLLTLLLCLTMSLTMFAGCGKKDDKKGGTGKDGKVTLTIALPMRANVEDYETNAFTLWLEEQTGYDLKFQLLATNATDYKSQISTMMVSGDKLPDIFWATGLEAESYRQYGEDGYFLDLTPYFEDDKYSKDYWDRVEEIYPEDFKEYVKEKIYDKSTGKIWAVPSIQSTVIDTMHYQTFINKTWLDKLGLSMPTDTESLYNVLKAFVTKDPNGNGKKDEIGIIGNAQWNGYSGVVDLLLNMFVNESYETWWNVDKKGQLYLPYTTDEYRQGLIYINKLVKEGLMPESVWAMQYKDIKTLVNPADGVNTVGIFCGHPSVAFQEGQESNYEYVPMPTWGHAVNLMNEFGKYTFITTDCENPDAAWNLLMLMCSEEGAARMRYGEKGVDWVEADKGAKSFLGWDAKIKILNTAAYVEGNKTWNWINGTILIDAENETNQMDENVSDWTKWKLNLMKESYDAYTASDKAKPENRSEPISYTVEESERTEVERENCQTWISSNAAKFCCGTDGMDPNNDASWKSYLDGFAKNGLEAWRAQVQKIYDAQIKNK